MQIFLKSSSWRLIIRMHDVFDPEHFKDMLWNFDGGCLTESAEFSLKIRTCYCLRLSSTMKQENLEEQCYDLESHSTRPINRKSMEKAVKGLRFLSVSYRIAKDKEVDVACTGSWVVGRQLDSSLHHRAGNCSATNWIWAAFCPIFVHMKKRGVSCWVWARISA